MSEVQLWTYIVVGITFALYIWIGYSNRVRDTKGFYVAGQGVPAVANGAATAADWMSAASFISMAGLISTMGYDGAIYLLGWTGGYVLLALLLAPYLRKFGKYTVPDFVGDRYYSQTARLIAAIATVIVSLTYVAGQMRGVGIVFSRFVGLPIEWGVVVGMAIVAFFALLGGMKGITWTQVAQYAVLIVAYMIPAVAIGLLLTGNPIPQLSFTFSDIVPRLNAVQIDLGFKEYTQPFQSKTQLDVLAVTIALMVGTAGLPHVITRFYTVPTVRAARYSAGWALLFIALLYTTAPAIAAFARYNLIDTLQTATVANVIPGEKQDIYELVYPDGTPVTWATSWQRTGLLAFYDKNGDGKIDLRPGAAFQGRNFKAPTDSANEVFFDNDIIVLANPEIAQLAPIVIALVAAGGLAAALSTASGLLLAMSSAVSHDIYYRIMRPNATERQRMVAGRTMILIAILFAGYFGINPPGFVSQVVAMAFGLAAASNFPAILLGIFDKRANSAGAIWGMSVGLGFTLIMILLMKSNIIFGTPAPLLNDFMGISAEGIGTIGMILNFAVALIVSRMTAAPPQEIQELVESVRIPRGAQVVEGAH
ncbi:MAG: cation acetate symporter [Chloroflexota bacterium]|nr:cation acetate symporter [Caldilinea sp.]GIK73350.1 MAG: cation acetate symporter [Chloroflexota bacterium]